MKTFIVIPTYNEKENIERLIKKIFNLNISNLFILIIDDNSPDGTGEIIENLKKYYSQLEIIHRPAKLGLGTAYKTGFEYALKQKADIIFEMDADFSHQPKYIPLILKELENYDLVIGSRYVKGGGMENCQGWRKFLSRLGNYYVEFILGLGIKDATAGFRGYHSKIFNKIDLKKIISNGYSFQVELVYLVKRKNFTVKEVPIIFPDRKYGLSKIAPKEIFRAITMVLKLKFKRQ